MNKIKEGFLLGIGIAVAFIVTQALSAILLFAIGFLLQILQRAAVML